MDKVISIIGNVWSTQIDMTPKWCFKHVETSIESINKSTINVESTNENRIFDHYLSLNDINNEVAKNSFILIANLTNTRNVSKDELMEPSSSVSSQIELNNYWTFEANRKFNDTLLLIIREQDFEYGYLSAADKYFQESIKQNGFIVCEWLNRLFVARFSDHIAIIGILRIVSHMDYSMISPYGPTMALAALSHIHYEVRECGIRAFENWERKEHIELLENTKCAEKWLDDYRKQVIEDLKRS